MLWYAWLCHVLSCHVMLRDYIFKLSYCVTVLHYITLHHIPLHTIAMHHFTLHYITPYITSHRITLHHIPLHHNTMNDITLRNITWHDITLHRITYHYFTIANLYTCNSHPLSHFVKCKNRGNNRLAADTQLSQYKKRITHIHIHTQHTHTHTYIIFNVQCVFLIQIYIVLSLHICVLTTAHLWQHI